MKLTLNKTWDECLRMWKRIAAQVRKAIKEGRDWDIGDLKAQWMRINGYSGIKDNCFFCHYMATHKRIFTSEAICETCPGGQYDKHFNCTKDPKFWSDPIGFYHKLSRLNRKRKAGAK